MKKTCPVHYTSPYHPEDQEKVVRPEPNDFPEYQESPKPESMDTVLYKVKDKIIWHRDFLQDPAKVVLVDSSTYIQLLREQDRKEGPADKLQILGVDVVRGLDVKGFKIY